MHTGQSYASDNRPRKFRNTNLANPNVTLALALTLILTVTLVQTLT